jgi:outer membrane receptor protein involved in Fe transport
VERFGRGGVQTGNPSLRPERGSSRDLGAILRWPSAADATMRMQIEVAGFQTRTADAIIWIQNSQRTTRAQNLERTKVDGAELTLRLALRPASSNLRLEQLAAATLQDPRDAGPSTTYHGRRLPYIPSRKGAVETRVDFRSVHLVHRLDHESAFYRDRYNSPGKRRGARTLQDFEIGYAISRGRIELACAIQNATNQRADDVEGFPLPGRSLSFDVIFRPTAGKGD